MEDREELPLFREKREGQKRGECDYQRVVGGVLVAILVS